MNCPNCGSQNHSESEGCIQCGKLAAGSPADTAAAQAWMRVLLEQCSSGRRKTIIGLITLCGAGVIMLALVSKGLPPFLALLWTCWMFLGGMIAFAEGCAGWLSSHRQIKALASASSRCPGGSGTETNPEEAGARPGQMASKTQSVDGERPIERWTILDKAGSR